MDEKQRIELEKSRLRVNARQFALDFVRSRGELSVSEMIAEAQKVVSFLES